MNSFFNGGNVSWPMLGSSCATFSNNGDQSRIIQPEPQSQFETITTTQASLLPQSPFQLRKRKNSNPVSDSPDHQTPLGLTRGPKLYISESAMTAKMSQMSLNINEACNSAIPFQQSNGYAGDPADKFSIRERKGCVPVPGEICEIDCDIEEVSGDKASDDEKGKSNKQAESQPRLELSNVLKDHLGRKTNLLPNKIIESYLEPKPCMELVLWKPHKDIFQSSLKDTFKAMKRQTLRASRSAESSSNSLPTSSFTDRCMELDMEDISDSSCNPSKFQWCWNLPQPSSYSDDGDEPMLESLSN